MSRFRTRRRQGFPNGFGEIPAPPVELTTYTSNMAKLNGTSQGFNVVDHADFSLGSGDWFIECRVKIIGNQFRMFDQFDGGSNWLQIRIKDGDVILGDSTAPANIAVQFTHAGIPSDMFHMVLQRKGNVCEFYVDGSLNASAALTVSLGNVPSKLEIGKSDNDSSFNNIELGMYNFGKGNSLSTAEITTIYNATKALCYSAIPSGIQAKITMSLPLANWTGFEGQELIDATGNAHNATNIASTPFTATDLEVECTPMGFYLTGAALFNGSSQFINQGQFANIGTGDATFIFRFKTGSAGGNRFIWSNENTTPPAGSFGIFLTSGGSPAMQFQRVASNFYSFRTTAGFADNEWHTVVILTNRANDIPIIYVDSDTPQALTLVNQAGTTAGGSISWSTDTTVGKRNVGASPLWYDGAVSFMDYQLGEMSGANITKLFSFYPRALCWDRYVEEGLDTNSNGFFTLSEFTGNTANALVDQSGTLSDAVNNGSTPFTSTGQVVECTLASPFTSSNISAFDAFIVHAYSMEETSGVLKDSYAGLHSTTTISGDLSSVTGKNGNAIRNATSATTGITFPSPMLDTTNNFAISCWLKHDTVYSATQSNIWAQCQNSSSFLNRIGFRPSTGQASFLLQSTGGGTFQINQTGLVSTGGVWHHMVATLQGNTMRLWINGVDKGTATFSGTHLVVDNTRFYARNFGASDSEPVDGAEVDELVFWGNLTFGGAEPTEADFVADLFAGDFYS